MTATTMQPSLLALVLPLVEGLSDEDEEVSVLWCPADLVGTKCPEPTWWSYMKCCGSLHKSCCSHVRLWVLVFVIALPIVLLIPPVVYLLRRLFCLEEALPSAPAPTRSDIEKDTAF